MSSAVVKAAKAKLEAAEANTAKLIKKNFVVQKNRIRKLVRI